MVTPQLAQQFFTGVSPGLAANAHFVSAMVEASHRCALQASEHIYDVNGMLLWAGGKPIDDHLLERLSDRPLRKPIELCVQARDPVAVAAAAETLERLVQERAELHALLYPDLAEIIKILRQTVPNPVELMFISVMRHGGVDRVAHATSVAAIALAVAARLGIPENLRIAIARAGLLHDLGELYLPARLLLPAASRDPASVMHYRSHVALGRQIALEVTRSGPVVAGLIATSHERLDGWGYPQGLAAADLSLPAQALLFAEAVATHLDEPRSNRLRRAAVSTRLIPGEFHRSMIDWLNSVARQETVEIDLEAIPESVERELKQLHVVLARIESLFGEIRHETSAALAYIRLWQGHFEDLSGILRASGVAEAVMRGIDLDVPDTREEIELASMCETLRYCIQSARLRIESQRDDIPELGTSVFTQELLEALYACDIELINPPEARGEHVAMPWSRIFSVGVAQIDEQHQTIVRMINLLYAAFMSGEDVRREVIVGLADYVAIHFATEERLMAAHHYAQSADHYREHEALTGAVAKLVAGLERGELPDIESLIKFLRHWLIVHILQSDMALGRALNAAGVH